MPLSIKFVKSEALIRKNFIKSVSRKVINNLKKRINNQVKNIQNIIKKNVRFSLGINFIMQSLKNRNSTLVASLGLDQQTAIAAYYKIIDIIDSIEYDINIKQELIKTGERIIVTVRLPSFEEYSNKFPLC